MLTEAQCPWTGPYGLPESGLKSKGPTPKALKRAMSRLDHLPWSENFDEQFNQALAHALDKWDPGHTGYGKGRWAKLRAAKIPSSLPHGGEYALDATALDLIRDDYKQQHPPPPPMPKMVYPHDKDFHSYSGGYVHPTSGIRGNYALDFLAPGETPVLAPEAGVITRLSGHDPRTGLHGSNQDVFGWSIYMRVPLRGFYYSTHYGRVIVREGQQVQAGQVVGYVGHWPYDPPRSHTHLGYTSFSYVAWVSRNKIRAVAASPRVDGVTVGQ